MEAMTEGPDPTRKDPPKLLQMMLSTQPGGAETFFEKLGLAFAEAGVPQCLIVEPSEDRERLFAPYPHVDVVPIRFGGLREPLARRRLRNAVRRFRPDVALTWMNRASRRAPRVDFPVIARLGGYYDLKYYRRCDAFVGITPDIVRHIRESRTEPARVEMIPNFGDVPAGEIDAAAARREVRQEHGIPREATVILALGRLHRAKAHDILFRALSQVPDTVLLLAGEGPLRTELEDLARELDIRDRVRFLGWRRDTARLFAAADICAFPSRYEPNGTVVMEAWAHRTPLIAARSKGPEWLVDHGETGLLVPVDDGDALAAALKRLMDDPVLRESLVANGYGRFERDFSRKAVVKQYLRFFEELLRKGKSR